MPTITVKLSDDDYAILEGLRGNNETKSEVIRHLLRRNNNVIPEPSEAVSDVLAVLKEQLKVKDRQIADLGEALKAAQVLQAAEKQPAMLERENIERTQETWRDRVRRWFS